MEISKISEWELHGDIGVLTLSNPPQNYLVEPEFVDFEDLKKWTDNDSLKGIIIRGKGRHFCAGFDKEEIFKITDKSVLHDALRRSEKTLYYLEDLPVPVIGAITGVCFGAGLELVLSCDIRVCSEKSLLSFPETEFGLIPGFNGMIRLPKRVGVGYPMELILSAKTIHADEALQKGIVDYVVPSKEVFDYSLNLLNKYATTPVNVLRAAMKAVNNARKLPWNAASAAETNLVAELVMEKIKKGQDAASDDIKPAD